MQDLLSKLLYNLNDAFKISALLYSLPGIIIGFTIHEFSHAYAAYLQGDKTAKLHGRLTLNPMAHFDLLGFLCLVFTRRFGWAKPVPVVEQNLRNRKYGMLWVALAGPLSNFITAFFMICVYYAMIIRQGGIETIFTEILILGFAVNVGLGVFNLLPIPPLDGSNIVSAFLSSRQKMLYRQYGYYFNIIAILLIFSGAIRIVLNPMYGIASTVISRFALFLIQLGG